MTRTCRSCGSAFVGAESIRIHKRDGLCRPPDTLLAMGWTLTPRGWRHPTTAPSPYARRKR